MMQFKYLHENKEYLIDLTEENLKELPEGGYEIIYNNLKKKYIINISNIIVLDVVQNTIKFLLKKNKNLPDITYKINVPNKDIYQIIYDFGFDDENDYIYFTSLIENNYVKLDTNTRYLHHTLNINKIFGIYNNDIPILSIKDFNLDYIKTKITIKKQKLITGFNKSQGMVYIVYNQNNLFAKFGYWTSSTESLLTRYETVYGKDLFLKTYPCNDPQDVENIVLYYMKDKIISGELIDINAIEECEKYIYSVINDPTDKKIMRQNLKVKKENKIELFDISLDMSYESLTLWIKNNIDNIPILIETKSKTEFDKNVLSVYYFNNLVRDFINNDNINDILWNKLYELFLNERYKNYFVTFIIELSNQNIDYLSEYTRKKFIKNINNSKYKIIIKLNEFLNFRNSFDNTKLVTEEKLLELYDLFSSNNNITFDSIKSIYFIRSSIKNFNTNRKKIKFITGYLNQIYNDWIGLSFKSKECLKKMTNGIVTRTYKFGLIVPENMNKIIDLFNKLIDH